MRLDSLPATSTATPSAAFAETISNAWAAGLALADTLPPRRRDDDPAAGRGHHAVEQCDLLPIDLVPLTAQLHGSRGSLFLSCSHSLGYDSGMDTGWIRRDDTAPHFRVEIAGEQHDREIAIARDFDAALAAWDAMRRKWPDREIILRQGATIRRRSSEWDGDQMRPKPGVRESLV